jgi:hypothetical protein
MAFYTMNYLQRVSGVLMFGLAAAAFGSAHASDHLDAPSLSGNGQVDINDLYAFQNPNNPDNSVLILTVNPGAGAFSPTDFGTDVAYQIQVDNTGDAVADITYEATFAGSGAAQTINLTRNGVAQAAGATGTTLPTASSGRVSTGVFDDPFFFDLNGFNNGFAFTGDDFFEGLNVSAIVLEVPNTDLNGADSNIGVWGRTVQGGSQVDRVGRPAINTALIGSDATKELFNIGAPADDFDDFGGEVNANIAALSDQANADALTPILLPDVLTFDTANSAGFLNGRGLADDVIDAELNLLSAGAVTGDLVDANAEGFLNVFPFLAPANVAAIPEPASVFSIALVFGTSLMRRRRSQGFLSQA